MRSAKLPMVWTLLVVFACFSLGQTKSETGLEGVIKISPTQPGPIRADAPDSQPIANTTFVAQNEKGAETTFTTDDSGRFRVSLEPGHYTVSRKGQKPAIGHFGPFNADVVAGKMTKVEWECDSGLR